LLKMACMQRTEHSTSGGVSRGCFVDSWVPSIGILTTPMGMQWCLHSATHPLLEIPVLMLDSTSCSVNEKKHWHQLFLPNYLVHSRMVPTTQTSLHCRNISARNWNDTCACNLTSWRWVWTVFWRDISAVFLLIHSAAQISSGVELYWALSSPLLKTLVLSSHDEKMCWIGLTDEYGSVCPDDG
jgi:hypothetical protein